MTDASSITRPGLFTAQTPGEVALLGSLTCKAFGDLDLGPFDGVMLQHMRGVVACA